MVKERTPQEREHAEARERYLTRMDRSLTDGQKAEIHAKRERRYEASKRHGVAIGWVDADGKLLPGAMRLDGSRPLNVPEREVVADG